MKHGFMVIQGNHLEDLTELTKVWLKENPLPPLEDDIFLVQSNGMAQWLKLELAKDDACGIATAQQFQMPIRFLWQSYRSVLGEREVPANSPFDKPALQWRFLQLLPGLLAEKEFTPLSNYLGAEYNQTKLFQLAQKLADLFDQYQVYRSDWLFDWEQGKNCIDQQPLPEDQLWQAEIWRALLKDLPAKQQQLSRSHIHRLFLENVNKGSHSLPQRIIVFGISSLPRQVLEALHALSQHSQIMLFVLNPCRHYWADIIEGRELLYQNYKRQVKKPSLVDMSPDLIHRHANPLLASWGKQGRDYINLLGQYDVPEHYQQWFNQIDLFTDISDHHLSPNGVLARVQQSILDLEAAPDVPTTIEIDNSIVFHQAHSAMREVEILHDQLLNMLANDDQLSPKDIIVMVPDINRYAPYIDAVFGALDTEDPRHLPYSQADQQQQSNLPIANAVHALLNLTSSRFTASDVFSLLEVPAIQKRFGLNSEDLNVLHYWISESGIRWGLDQQQRADLELPQNNQNSWRFGLDRMMLGFSNGDNGAWKNIEPLHSVTPLNAILIGKLTTFIELLQSTVQILNQNHLPPDWAKVMSRLLDQWLDTEQEADLIFINQFQGVLEKWLQQCSLAEFDQTLPLAIVRRAWQMELESQGISQRFLAGRINFCSLMPMRSIPFKVVCLLGMNEEDYPRQTPPMDFDLMRQAGAFRAGDRSRRDDDNYLFLEALLSCRQQLYISWVGQDIRDNHIRPASVLVAQLQDFIDQCWRVSDNIPLSSQLTTRHPLQPFSHHYFTEEGLISFASEWHHALSETLEPTADGLPLAEETNRDDLELELSVEELTRFMKRPYAHFFNHRLGIHYQTNTLQLTDTETFEADGLEYWHWSQQLLTNLKETSNNDIEMLLGEWQARLTREGKLLPGFFGEKLISDLKKDGRELHQQLHCILEELKPTPACAVEHDFKTTDERENPHIQLQHWLNDVFINADQQLHRTGLCLKSLIKNPWEVHQHWIIHLLACSNHIHLTTTIIDPDGLRTLAPIEAATASSLLDTLLQAWHLGLTHPIPLAHRSAYRYLQTLNTQDSNAALSEAENKYQGVSRDLGDAGYDLYLQRIYPDFQSITAIKHVSECDYIHWAEQLYQPVLTALMATQEQAKQTEPKQKKEASS